MEEGIKIGKEQGELELLLRQVKHRFGELPAETEGRVRTLSEAQVNDLATALFDFSKLEDLRNWLQNQPAEKDKQ
jgi:hypothetical protein